MTDQAKKAELCRAMACAADGDTFWAGRAGIWMRISAHQYATYLIRIEMGDIDDIQLVRREVQP
jgi:hypothetical protein